MKRDPSTQIKIGTYPMGHINVDLLAWPYCTGGEFYFCPDSESKPRIRLGLDYEIWDECLATLLHEVFEFAMAMNNCRFKLSGKLNGDHADYRFFMDHCEFGNICSCAAMFLQRALPDTATAFRKARKH